MDMGKCLLSRVLFASDFPPTLCKAPSYLLLINMRTVLILLAVILTTLSGCKKDELQVTPFDAQWFNHLENRFLCGGHEVIQYSTDSNSDREFDQVLEAVVIDSTLHVFGLEFIVRSDTQTVFMADNGAAVLQYQHGFQEISFHHFLTESFLDYHVLNYFGVLTTLPISEHAHPYRDQMEGTYDLVVTKIDSDIGLNSVTNQTLDLTVEAESLTFLVGGDSFVGSIPFHSYYRSESAFFNGSSHLEISWENDNLHLEDNSFYVLGPGAVNKQTIYTGTKL